MSLAHIHIVSNNRIDVVDVDLIDEKIETLEALVEAYETTHGMVLAIYSDDRTLYRSAFEACEV